MYSGGSGTQLDPYLIANVTDLKDIESNMSAYFKQIADITLGTFEPIGYNSGSSPLQFTGVYDGGDYSIKNGTITYPLLDFIGIWRLSKGTIRNLRLSNIVVIGNDCVGIVLGSSTRTNITNVHTDAGCQVSGRNYIGGLIGALVADSGTKVASTGCSNKASVTATGNSCGGIAGSLGHNSINNCYNTGAIIGVNQVGGIAGTISGSGSSATNTITYCYNSGNITAVQYGGGIVGQFISTQYTYATRCYALCDTITRTSGFATTFGRISGSEVTRNSNNYALDTIRFVF